MDCSTFAFDLHVLGTPPALILSQDQTLMLNSSPFDSPACAGSLRDNCLTRGRFIGSCVVQSVLIESGSSPVAFARTDNSGRPIDAMPPADSHCPTSLSLACARSSSVVTGCVCLHAYLVFKEPTAVRQWRSTRHPVRLAARPTVQVLPGRPRRLSVTARLGEPSEVTIPSHLCQHQNRESVLKKTSDRCG
jgi:hypothetical protein